MGTRVLVLLTVALVGVAVIMNACVSTMPSSNEGGARSTSTGSTEITEPAPPSLDSTPAAVSSPEIVQPAPPPSASSPTPVPTLGTETRWREPEAKRAVVVELPSPSGGQDLYLVKPDGSEPLLLVHIQESVDAAQASPDGKYLAIKISPHYGVYNEDLLLLSLESLRMTPVVQNGAVYTFAWAPNGDSIAYAVITQDHRQQIWLYTLHEAESRMLFEWNGTGGWRVLGWDPGGEKLFLAHNVGGGLLDDEVVLLNVATGEKERIYADPQKRTGWEVPAPNGKMVAITRAVQINSPEQELLLLDLAEKRVTSLIESGDPLSRIASIPLWSPDSRRLAFTVTEPSPKGVQAPMRVVILDVLANRTTVVTEVAAPPMLVRPLDWASDHVLIVNNLGGEPLDEVVYSIRDDGSNVLKIAWGRFLTTVP